MVDITKRRAYIWCEGTGKAVFMPASAVFRVCI